VTDCQQDLRDLLVEGEATISAIQYMSSWVKKVARLRINRDQIHWTLGNYHTWLMVFHASSHVGLRKYQICLHSGLSGSWFAQQVFLAIRSSYFMIAFCFDSRAANLEQSSDNRLSLFNFRKPSGHVWFCESNDIWYHWLCTLKIWPAAMVVGRWSCA
jgi:hypothetical protein